MESQRPWHHLFGLSLIDFFRGQPVTVELEKDLSLKQQLLDVVILHKGAAPARRLRGLVRSQLHHLQVASGGAGRLGLVRVDRPLRELSQTDEPEHEELVAGIGLPQFAVSVRFPQNLAREFEFILLPFISSSRTRRS
jgi:hypothetical protein